MDKPGFVPSERLVGEALDHAFSDAPGRVIVATFASNLSRVQQVIDVSRKYGRKVALAGRSMIGNVDVARELGYITVGDEDTIIRLDDVAPHAPDKVTIISTGSQGEPLAALSRIARGDHRQVAIAPGDTVVYSSRTVPGNARPAPGRSSTAWRARRREVITQESLPAIHVSGTAPRPTS